MGVEAVGLSRSKTTVGKAMSSELCFQLSNNSVDLDLVLRSSTQQLMRVILTRAN